MLSALVGRRRVRSAKRRAGKGDHASPVARTFLADYREQPQGVPPLTIIDLYVTRGRRERFVAHEFLDDSNVRTAPNELGAVPVAQLVTGARESSVPNGAPQGG